MNDVSKYLTIVLITYNRDKYLVKTLEQFLNSPFINCKFVIQNNCSTDDTEVVAQNFKNLFPSLKIVTNKFNIGANANIMRAIENSNTEYTWIIADDDSYDFSDCNDIIYQLQTSKFNIIQVGGHNDTDWIWGMREATPKELRNEKYPYFKYSSFIASSIFKTEFFIKHVIEGYNNIKNAYPHMPYLFKIYMEDQPIYISKKRIIIANTNNGSYTSSHLIDWWMNTCELLPNKKDKRACFIEQYDNKGNQLNAMKVLLFKYLHGNITLKQYLMSFKLYNPLQIIVILGSYLVYYGPVMIIRYMKKILRYNHE